MSQGRIKRWETSSKITEYFLTSLPKKKYGSRDYPVEYTYDPQGRLKTQTTWTNFAGNGGAAVTTWHFHPERGWITNKVYADGQGTKYGYTAGSRLSARLWARGTNTTYSYNHIGDLSDTTYTGTGTPSVTQTYTRRGQLGKVVRDGITTTLFYNTAGQLLSESYSGGTLNGLRVTNTFDAQLRRTQVATKNGASALNATDYTYDNASRLSSVNDGTQSATYSYVANSPLVSQIAFKQSSTTRMTTRKAYDNLNRLQTITHREGETPSNPLLSSFAYSHNDANQRTRAYPADGSYWSYEYDSLGQVKTGKRYWSDGTPVAGQQFEYGFDDIGNRRTTKTGGDSAGAGLRSASYTLNNLNQITQRTVPGAADVIGAATATATNVNVNNVMAYRRGEYYRVELSINNASAAQWQSVTNRAVQNGTTNSVTGNVFLPLTPEVISHDADGNLTNDGHWAYTWDGENRLTRLVVHSSLPSGARQTLLFSNDWIGRRISKVVSNWTGSAWSKTYENKFLYDGWNLVAVLDSANTLQQSFRWGTDLSGTLQGAGGVGGLISMTVHTGAYAGTYFYAYDGNANVAALINAADGTVAARYEYGPFHELIRATGPLAFINPFRASTKYQDDETGFLYYGFRYYDPSTGRWPNRDPIEETGGFNPFVFVSNDSVSGVDALGLLRLTYHSQGFANFDPVLRFWSYDRQYGESGNGWTAKAFFWQTATQTRPCPGGICNSGDPLGSSFVSATLRNDSYRCTITITCSCTIGYAVSNRNPTRNRGATANGCVLGTRFNFSHMPVATGDGWYVASGYNVVSRTETFSLKPLASKELYFGRINVATIPNAVGAGFSENMEGDCSCK